MAYIEWNEEHKTNVSIIDDEHDKIAKLANEIYNSLGDNDKCKLLFADLTEQVQTHFETEETLMKKFKDVHYISHKLEHDRMFKKVSELNDLIQSGEKTVGLDFIKSFRNWLFNHLELNDKKTGKFLTEHGVS
ncbi:MAG: bacteriohemerythrin [Melioribacteraceae bacterium]|nr:bacteriohemerythrin [Melioribacteraceae bacterium]MCF8266273.1 bacteriohemerythrin [Melioribacteraceae bacterium]MCF8431940.1 bacteriohemerythrin [Melioribacteraceae bacterium]